MNLNQFKLITSKLKEENVNEKLFVDNEKPDKSIIFTEKALEKSFIEDMIQVAKRKYKRVYFTKCPKFYSVLWLSNDNDSANHYLHYKKRYELSQFLSFFTPLVLFFLYFLFLLNSLDAKIIGYVFLPILILLQFLFLFSFFPINSSLGFYYTLFGPKRITESYFAEDLVSLYKSREVTEEKRKELEENKNIEEISEEDKSFDNEGKTVESKKKTNTNNSKSDPKTLKQLEETKKILEYRNVSALSPYEKTDIISVSRLTEEEKELLDEKSSHNFPIIEEKTEDKPKKNPPKDEESPSLEKDEVKEEMEKVQEKVREEKPVKQKRKFKRKLGEVKEETQEREEEELER